MFVFSPANKTKSKRGTKCHKGENVQLKEKSSLKIQTERMVIVSISDLAEEFFARGFIVLHGCMPTDLLSECRSVMTAALADVLGSSVSLDDGIRSPIVPYHQFDVQDLLHAQLQAKGLKRRILLQPFVLEVLLAFLGPDLAYNREAGIAINLREVTEGLYRKRLHQEVWSGACVNEVRIWLPLSMTGVQGGLELLPGSHLWGLVPNRNREPSELPPDYETITPPLGEGDAVLFHSLTLHATVENPLIQPRVALTTAVRNVYHPLDGLSQLQSWQPFLQSPIQLIQKALGNPWLTPFRTLGGSLSHRFPGDGKERLSAPME